MLVVMIGVPLVAFVFTLLTKALLVVGDRVSRFLAYRRTRNVAPAAGQYWSNDQHRYKITNVWTRDELVDIWTRRGTFDESKLPKTLRIGITSGGNVSYSVDLEEWRRRVRRGRFHCSTPVKR
jgi:hypothetical protein